MVIRVWEVPFHGFANLPLLPSPLLCLFTFLALRHAHLHLCCEENDWGGGHCTSGDLTCVICGDVSVVYYIVEEHMCDMRWDGMFLYCRSHNITAWHYTTENSRYHKSDSPSHRTTINYTIGQGLIIISHHPTTNAVGLRGYIYMPHLYSCHIHMHPQHQTLHRSLSMGWASWKVVL